ncbi:MAG TPA: TraB/GumN family protein [Steroidobacteraceae bacterium]|nr:TraB/GumN family protein [Steroidobacteraceae bacterium]
MLRTLAALCLLGCVSAQAQSPVWAIHGAHNTVYLAESVHLLKPGHSQLPAAFDRAYATAKTLVMEIDLSRLEESQLQSWMLEHGTFKDQMTLQQAIGEQRYQRLTAEASRLGLPLETLQQFEPWAVALTLADLEYLKLGYDPEQGVEQQLERRATQDRKEMRGLETLEEQLGQLERLSYEQQGRFLEMTVDEMRDAEKDTDELLAAWRAGDNRRLADLMSDEYESFPELYRALVSERNRHWLPQIEQFLKDDHDYLVVVGALHLVGKDGLLDLMRRDGFTPAPVLAAPR